MANTMVAPQNKPAAMMGKKPPAARTGGSVTVPSAAAEAKSAKKKASGMLAKGLISDAQHASLQAKADRLLGVSTKPPKPKMMATPPDADAAAMSPVMPGNP